MANSKDTTTLMVKRVVAKKLKHISIEEEITIGEVVEKLLNYYNSKGVDNGR